MSGRKTFVGGDILLASELNSFLMDQSVMVFDDAAARDIAIPSPSEGMTVYLEDSNFFTVYDGSSWKTALATTGSILQLVSATDSTQRTTSSASFVDANISISVTPKSASSILIVGWSGQAYSGVGSSANQVTIQITTSDDAPLSGAEDVAFYAAASDSSQVEIRSGFDIVAFVEAGSTSTRTYKGRFRRTNGTATLRNDARTGRMFVMEVAA
jgi:hypothetical protein